MGAVDKMRPARLVVLSVRAVAILVLVWVAWRDPAARHFVLWIFVPVLLCVGIPHGIRALAIRSGHKFSVNWEIVLVFVFFWILLLLHYFHRKFAV